MPENHLHRSCGTDRRPLSSGASEERLDRHRVASAPAVRRDDEPPDHLPALLCVRAIATSRCCGSTSAASGAARAHSTTARASCRTPPRRSTGRSRINPEARSCWIAGFSFGAWIGMQLLMRRPEIEGFISIRAAREPLRLLVPGPLPVVGADHPRRQGRGSSRTRTSPAWSTSSRPRRASSSIRRFVPGANHFFDGKDRAADAVGRRLSGQAPQGRERKPSAA